MSLISASTGPNSATYNSCAAARSNSWGLPHRDGFRQFFDIEAAAKGGDLRRHVLLAERNRPPLETLARERKNVALVGPCQEEHKGLVGAKQLLHLFRHERLRMCERGIFGEFLVETCGNCVKAALVSAICLRKASILARSC